DSGGVEIVGKRESGVLGSEDCHVRRCPLGRGTNVLRGDSASLRRTFRLKARHDYRRSRSRALHFSLPEYSSICVVRSSGYEMATSVIVPSAAKTGSSRGCTNPVYDGMFKCSTRATTSS